MSEQEDIETKLPEQKNNHTRRNKIILETSIDGFCVVDLDGKLLEVNSSLCDITGYSKEELLKMKLADIEVLETTEQIAQHIAKVMKQGYDRFETKHRRKDGEIIDIEVSVQFCGLDENKFFFTFFRDITQRKKIEEKLRELIYAMDHCGEGLAIVDTQGVLQYINNAFAGMHGYEPEELHGKHLSIFHSPEQIPAVEAANRQLVSTGSFVGEIWHSRRDGTVFLTRMNCVLLIDKAGNTIGLIGTLQDITELKQLETERDIYKGKVFKAQRHAYIGSMGAIVAHQVNQPLTKINILLDRVLDKAEDGSCCPAVVKDVKKSIAEVKKAVSIIRKFRQYSKDFIPEGVGKINLSAVADRIVSVLSQRAKQAKMRISTKGLANLPEVEINETALEQIFFIIIQNAIEAADDKKPHKLDIIGKFTDGNIELRFSDDCCGIAPENIDKIFEPFFSTKTEDQGMGLGLNIVQQLLMNCGGQIRVESQLGSGTTFYVTLPISNTLGT
jgi:two-component system cell cycle sensor histidine kinase/response regulator CckA